MLTAIWLFIVARCRRPANSNESFTYLFSPGHASISAAVRIQGHSHAFTTTSFMTVASLPATKPQILREEIWGWRSRDAEALMFIIYCYFAGDVIIHRLLLWCDFISQRRFRFHAHFQAKARESTLAVNASPCHPLHATPPLAALVIDSPFILIFSPIVIISYADWYFTTAVKFWTHSFFLFYYIFFSSTPRFVFSLALYIPSGLTREVREVSSLAYHRCMIIDARLDYFAAPPCLLSFHISY